MSVRNTKLVRATSHLHNDVDVDCRYRTKYCRQSTVDSTLNSSHISARQLNLPDLNGSSFFYSFVGREALDSADMEDLDRQRRADLMRDTIMDKLAETGEKDKLKDMLRDRLILSGEIHVKNKLIWKVGRLS